MAAHGATRLPVGTTGLPIGEEVQEYEKILKINDEIFSGTHSKLKVPQQFVRKAAPRHHPNPPSTQPQVARTGGLGKYPPENPSRSTPLAPEPTRSQTTASSVNGPSDAAAKAPASKTRTVTKPTSEIDPIFLTKSDDLVRAELQLQRQRVERALRDQLEQKRQESRQKAAVQDTKPDFDVSDVLYQALELVKPASVNDISPKNGTGAPSDSFDENSFYSSRAPDSPQHGEQQQRPPSPAPPSHPGDLATEIPVENYSDELQRLEALNRAGLVQEMQNTYPVADQRVPYYYRQHHDAPVDPAANKFDDVPQQPDDTIDEPDYSPPAPGVPPMDRADTDRREYQPESTGGARRQVESRPSDRGGRYPRRSISPRGDVRIVRNHITSPAAPQPSRVSPLAMAKVPSVQDLRSRYGPERVHTGQDSDRASPDAPAAQRPMPRKRRRLQEESGRSRQVSYKRPGAVDSSNLYIKEEPVSPPPFADTPPAFQGRPAQPVYIDIASPRYTPVMERREPSIREPAYEPDPYHEIHVEPSRAASRLSVRRPIRDDQDLRRVASLQHARQPEYARDYVDQPSPRGMRAASYAVLERPPQERVRYYDEPVPSYSRRYIPADGPSPTSPRFREAYYDDELPPARIMAPPTRRIVVDEHGNQYYEAPAPVQFMPPASRRSEVFDDGASVRQASVRAGSIFEDLYGGRRYVQEMPPPQNAYRRVAEYARPVANGQSYATPLDEREPFPRGGSVQVGEYPPRRTAYMEDVGPPRERMVRMSSVRPPPARYEEPREVIPRVASVRPGEQDMGVYMDEDPPRPMKYIERPMYVSTRPVSTRPPPMREEQQYYDGEAERVMMDGARNGMARGLQRF